MSLDPIRIFIVDDHPIIHDGLEQGFRPEGGFTVVGHADTAESAIAQVSECLPDVILLDISLAGMSGLDAIPLLKNASPASAVVIFSMLDKEGLIQRAIRLGALGYVLKGAGSNEIAAAVLAAHQGRHYLSAQIEQRVVGNYMQFCKSNSPVNNYDLLTVREQQVFRLLVEGFSTAKIAKNIHLSPKTVEKHRSSIVKKLGIQETVALVKFAIEIGVIDPHSWPK